MANGLPYALPANFIQQVEARRFDPNAGQASRAATYGLRWASDLEAAPASKV